MTIGVCDVSPLATYNCGKGGYYLDTYPVIFEGEQVGSVNAECEGLYYHFCCRCTIPDDPLVCLYVNQQMLGVLVPEKGHLCLATKVPRKRFLESTLTFYLERKYPVKEDSISIPICAEEAFPHIEYLQNATFHSTLEGQTIRIPVKCFHPAEEDHQPASL